MPGDQAVSDREEKVLQDHRDRPLQAPALQGGPRHDGPRGRRQGDADPDRGPAAARPRLRGGRARRARRLRRRPHRGPRPGDEHRQLRGQAAPVPGRLDRRARGERHRERPGDGRCEARRPEPLADPRGGAPRRRPARRGRGDRRGRRGRGRRGDHRRHQGRRARRLRRHVHLHRGGRQARRPRRAAGRARSSPETGSSSPARSATTARRSCSPAASSISSPPWSPTPARCGRRPTR